MNAHTRPCRPQHLIKVVSAIVLGAALAACGGSDGGSSGGSNPAPAEYKSGRPAATTIPVTTAAMLADAIGIEGAARVSGNIPAPTPLPPLPGHPPSYGGTMTAIGQILFTDNSTFRYTFSSASAPTAVFAQIDGADNYFVIPFAALVNAGAGNYTITFYGSTAGDTQIINSAMSGQLILQAFYGTATLAELLTNTFPGSADVANWSAPIPVDYESQAVMTGYLQFNLTWDTANDVDLHLAEPDGNTINWVKPSSPGGGKLDVEDVNGYGPENIFWATVPPPGTYSVLIENFDGDAAPNYTLTVTRQGVSTVYTGALPNVAGAQSTPIQITVP